MARLIDIDALVAEIERRIKSLHQVNSPREQAVLYECKDILSFLDTLETKEEVNTTDAFIDKAVEYIANNMRCDGYTLQTKAKFIKDFKDHMKGE